jgi:hypothetical protein
MPSECRVKVEVGGVVVEMGEKKQHRILRLTYRLRWTSRVGLILAGLLFVMWLSNFTGTQHCSLLTYAPPAFWPPPA